MLSSLWILKTKATKLSPFVLENKIKILPNFVESLGLHFKTRGPPVCMQHKERRYCPDFLMQSSTLIDGFNGEERN